MKYILFGFIVFNLLVNTLGQAEWNLVNLDDKCMFCLCEAATGCDMTRLCTGGYCGPFKLSRAYWHEAGNLTMQADHYRRAGAFEACANDFYCARRIVKHYLSIFGRDCNEDGVTNCIDYVLINFTQCQKSLEQSKREGLDWVKRYAECMEN